MAEFIVKNLAGTSELLTDYSNITRKQRVNGDRSLSFFVIETTRNQHAFPLVVEESTVEYDGIEYRIKNVEERTISGTPVKSVTASHVFFDIVDVFQYETLTTGSKSINQALSHALQNTGYTFTVIDSFNSVKLEEFGNDTALALFQTVLEKYQAEFDIVGTDVKIRSKIGSTIDLQFRYGHNVKTFSKSVNTNNLSTYIKGYGKEIEGPKDVLSGTTINYASRTGTWADLSEPNHHTTQVGATFTFTFTGTGFKFRHYADSTGGVWEFAMDGKKKRISTWSETIQTKTVEVFRDLESKPYTVIATFKGDDPKHQPYTGKNTSKGWVKYDTSGGSKTVDLYRALVGEELFTCVAEYTSPMSATYGIRHAAPVKSDTITTESALLDALTKTIKDSPEITFELEFVELQNAGYTVTAPRLGDTVPTIYEPLNVDVDLRVLEIEDYPETTKSPKVTLSNVKKRFADVQFNRVKVILDKIYDENSGKLRNNVYDEAVKRATEALNNSLTELEYPEGMGIIARDPNDASRFTAFRSAGIGITTNGGETFDNAITPDGVTTNLLTAGQIKTNNIQIIGNDDLFYWDGTKLIAIDAVDPNKYTQLNSDGLYSARGTLTVERENGYKTIIGGKVNQDFNIQGGTPPFLVNCEVLGRHFKTNNGSQSPGICQVYTFKKTARYLKFHVSMGVDKDGNQATAFIEQTGVPGVWLASVTATANISDGEDKHITVDLGEPDGSVFAVYLRLYTNSTDTGAYVRVIRSYLTDF